MTWRSFLGCASAMVALHDSDAAPGPARKASREREKPDRNNAYWLDLGIRLLTFLQAKEERDNQPMVTLEEILDAVQTDHPNATLEDVRYCAQRLTQPTTVMFLAATGNLDPVETTLLQRPHSSLAAVGLSAQGRQTLSFSISLGDTQFADLDAQKMRRLIEDGQYSRARDSCAELLTRLRGTGHAITEADERLGADDLRCHFFEKGASYAGAIDQTQAIAHGSLEFVDALLDGKQSGTDYVALIGLQDELRTLLTACQRLDRHLARLLKRLNEMPAATGKMFRFDHLLAHWLVTAPPGGAVMQAMAEITVPPQLATVPLDPTPLRGVVPAPPPPPSVERVVLRPLTAFEDPSSSARMAELFAAYSQFLEGHVNGSPVSLFALLAGELPMPPVKANEIATLYGTTLASQSAGGRTPALEVTPGHSVTVAVNAAGHAIRGHDILITRSEANGSC